MKKIFFIIITALSMIINAQTVSLELMAQCKADPSVCPENFDYVKDVNHLLNKYVGTWKGSLEGKNYEFNFIKKENVEEQISGIKWDVLIGRVRITNQNGTVEFDNFNLSDEDANMGYNFHDNLKIYLVGFSGNKIGCNDSGFLYLRKPNPANKMKIDFYPVADIVTQDCSNFKTTIPTNRIINLTKQ